MSAYRTKMFDRIDKICWNRYGSSDDNIVSWVIEQNPGLELCGILLPMGMTINLPEPPKKLKAPPVLKQIFLWN